MATSPEFNLKKHKSCWTKFWQNFRFVASYFAMWFESRLKSANEIMSCEQEWLQFQAICPEKTNLAELNSRKISDFCFLFVLSCNFQSRSRSAFRFPVYKNSWVPNNSIYTFRGQQWFLMSISYYSASKFLATNIAGIMFLQSESAPTGALRWLNSCQSNSRCTQPKNCRKNNEQIKLVFDC